MSDEPRADASEPKAEIFISRNNQTHGPYPRHVVESWINTGKINRYDLACTDNTPWQPVGKLLWPAQYAKATSGLTGKQWALIIGAIVGFVVLIAIARLLTINGNLRLLRQPQPINRPRNHRKTRRFVTSRSTLSRGKADSGMS